MSRFAERYGAIAKNTICETPEALYGPVSRRMIGDLCRAFLDPAILTPIELLHVPAYQTDLTNRGGLIQHATTEIANIQSVAIGKPPQVRRSELHNLIDAVATGTQSLVDEFEYPTLDPANVSAAISEVEKVAKTAQRAFHVYHLISVYLANSAGWGEKLARLETLFRGCQDQNHYSYLDALLAEILTSPAAWRGFLDDASTLCARLSTIIDLGNPPSEDTTESLPNENASRIRTLLADYPTPESKEAVRAVVHQALAGPAPLTPGPTIRELGAARNLFDKLVRDSDHESAESLAKYIADRMERSLTRDSLNVMLQGTPTVYGQVSFLIRLLKTVIGPTCQKLVSTRLEAMIMDRRLGPNLTSGPDIIKTLREIGELVKQLADAPIPEKLKTKLTRQIGDLQTRHIKNQGVFAHIEKAGKNSWAKLEILSGLAVCGSFTEGRNLDAAKTLISHYLAQKDLKPSMISNLTDPTERESRLTRMRQRLEKLGIPLALR